ncbi:MAG TPA: lipopolysaccharide heptosyltransferase II [Actinomycetota bacterium]|nr:lipopolysaccharide heptosyltransferase II [Actinomycetota bacterium]
MNDRSDAWKAARRILCVRLDTLGDVLMTTPALRALKESGAGRSITLLTSPRGAEVAPFIPEVDDVRTYDAPWMPSGRARTGSDRDLELAAELRRRRFDAAVIFTVYSQNPLPAALLCYLGEIPLRLAHSRENPYSLLTDWVPEPEPDIFVRHEVRRQLDLVKTVGSRTDDETLSFRVPREAVHQARALLKRMGIDPARRNWVIIHPGASAPSRRYPAESYLAVAARLRALGYEIVFTGTEEEAPLVERIRKDMGVPSHSLVGQLAVAELGGVLAQASVLITNNTGPVHIASALGTPVVDLYALTNPQHAPWGTPSRVLSHDVPCKYCYKSVCPEGHHNCLRLVTPDQVIQATRELLAGSGRPGSVLESAPS